MKVLHHRGPILWSPISGNRYLRGSNQIDLPADFSAHTQKEASSQVTFNFFLPNRDLVFGMVFDLTEGRVGHAVKGTHTRAAA